MAAQPDFVVPPPANPPPAVQPGPYLNVGVGEYYLVSAAVFYKRNFNPPNFTTPSDIGEPVGTAAFPGTSTGTCSPPATVTPGLGGGDVILSTTNPAWLDLKQNEWILLGGYTIPSLSGCTPTTPPPQRYIMRWYRIVALGESSEQIPNPVTGSNYTVGLARRATLAGPDWDLIATPSTGAPPPGPPNPGVPLSADVILYRGVVDVHTTTMKLAD